MRVQIGAFVSLLFAVVATLWIRQDNGYFLIGYGHWSIEGSLALLLLTGAGFFMLLYVLIRTLARLWRMPEQLLEWNGRRQATRARYSLTQGLLKLAEGNWKQAETHLVRHAGQSDTPLVNYLAAARAAQLQGADERRDSYLQLAHQSTPAADVAVGLTQAELQLDQQQYEQALATLQHIRAIAPKHSHVLLLLKRLYTALQDWASLEQLLAELLKQKVVSEAEHAQLELKVYQERMTSLQHDSVALKQLWQRMPKALRQRQPFFKTYTGYLVELGEGSVVAPLIAESLNRQWDSELVRRYGRIETADLTKQLMTAEAWLSDQPQDADLQLCLARLCLKSRLWGKARTYLEASIGIEPRVEAYQELGLLLEQLGEPDRALECFKTGLGLERRGKARRLVATPDNRPDVHHQAAESAVMEGTANSS